jgi:hypothetical protein
MSQQAQDYGPTRLTRPLGLEQSLSHCVRGPLATRSQVDTLGAAQIGANGKLELGLPTWSRAIFPVAAFESLAIWRHDLQGTNCRDPGRISCSLRRRRD